MPQGQALLAIQAVDPLMVVSEALATQHYVHAPIAVVNTSVGNLVNAHYQPRTVSPTGLVAVQGTGNHDHRAGLGHPHTVTPHQITNQFTAQRRLQSFLRGHPATSRCPATEPLPSV